MHKYQYIYTSGTTGLPKAAIILHSKMILFGMMICNVFQVTENDRNYCVLPLFHSAGGGLGVGAKGFAVDPLSALRVDVRTSLVLRKAPQAEDL